MKGEPWWPLTGLPESTAQAPSAATWPDLDFDPAPHYERLTIPILCFFGETDMWTPVDDTVRMWREAVDRGGHEPPTVVRLDGCGHEPALHEGGPVHPRYEEALLDWLDARAAAPAS
ncbi:alpha/beta hydrolase family protein [Phytomonospora endophytica]|uniref:Pimeloyl-ACP methyl ester carboxylesterase n=1 Tax=Phytomonospora endophytica TaxID=714109 RepID=A0A841FS32_9ACTN|nr:hypothetical protein [Phytomonospora endophytica]MBB6036117.1 pimeloyl-ACP methyl ester carboxylesterase [Phytomonospora endophytica]